MPNPTQEPTMSTSSYSAAEWAREETESQRMIDALVRADFAEDDTKVERLYRALEDRGFTVEWTAGGLLVTR